MEGGGTEGLREDTLAYGHENLGLSLWCRSPGVSPPTMLFLVAPATCPAPETWILTDFQASVSHCENTNDCVPQSYPQGEMNEPEQPTGAFPGRYLHR